MKSESRNRMVVAVAIAALILLALTIAAASIRLAVTAEGAAVQQTDMTQAGDGAADSEIQDRDSQSASKTTSVPDLVSLIGMDRRQAIDALGHGAQLIEGAQPLGIGAAAAEEVQIALTEEPSDIRSGTPTVYLSLDDAGTIVGAGYSTSLSSLGYGSISFADAIENELVVEETLADAGLIVSRGSAILPKDKIAYSSYDTDGTTLMTEDCSFGGEGMASGISYGWTAEVEYDYSIANATDNLNDTVRMIYIYISSQ